MSNVIKFLAKIKQQVFPSLPRAQEYAQMFMCNDVYATANIVPMDSGEYVVTVFPHDDLMARAVRNAKREWNV